MIKLIFLYMNLLMTLTEMNSIHFNGLVCQAPEQVIVCENEDMRAAVKEVILGEMVTWVNPNTGEVDYTTSCRNQEGGCEEHIDRIVDIIFELSCESGFDPFMILAMAKHESNYNPFVVNDRTGATGLLQLMPRSFFAKDIDFIHNARYRNECRQEEDYCQEEILHASFRLLYRSIARCGDIDHGLGMYGSGSCEGSKRFVRYVNSHKQRLLEESIIVYERNMSERILSIL